MKNEQLNFGVTQIKKKKLEHLTIPVVIVCCEASDVIANVLVCVKTGDPLIN